MFSRYGNNEHDQKHSDSNERTDIGDSAALILTSQYLENANRNYSFYNHQNSINSHNPIFIQPEQIDAYSSGDATGHEHLMILAAAAVNSSPSNDSCKSGSNPGEAAVLGTAESPHFSIHDPPLIRLSPTSPNNLFRHGRYNDDFPGMTNQTQGSGISSNNVDWLSQELFVKTENASDELTHSSLKRHSFNSSLSDAEFPSARGHRGLAHGRHTHESRGFDIHHNSSPQYRPRKDLKRKRLYNPESEFEGLLVNNQHDTSNSADECTTNINTSTYINLTESDGEVHIDERSDLLRDRLTPELPRRHFQWWPMKRHCPEPGYEERDSADLPGVDDIASTPHVLVSSSTDAASPLLESSHITPQFSPCSPPFYMFSGSNADTLANYPETQQLTTSHSETPHNDIYNNLTSQATIDHSTPMSTLQPNSVEYQTPQTTLANVTSYLRNILVPEYRNRRRYAVSNLPASFRDFSRIYLPPSPDRHCPYRASSQSGILDHGQHYPRRSSSGSFVHATVYDPDGHSTSTNQNSSSRLAAPVNNGLSEDHPFVTNVAYRRSNIPPTMNTFLRAYGLEEVQQRAMEEPYHNLRDPRIHNDPMAIHPFLRISDRNFINPMLDNRPGSQFSRPFTMYESPGNVESVIQLALHLETSWRGISPEELSRLPCHYYSHVDVESLNHSDKQDKCMVCLDEFRERDQLRTLSCGHQYHISCVDKWLKMNRTCPMCRSDAVLGSSSYLYVN